MCPKRKEEWNKQSRIWVARLVVGKGHTVHACSSGSVKANGPYCNVQ